MRILHTIAKRILALVLISFFGFLGIALLCLENDFLNAPTDESLTVWHAAWVGVLAVTLAGGLSLGLSIFMLVMTILDMLGLSQKVKDQMARFRRKVESA